MDIPDSRVDIAHDDVRSTRTPAQDLPGRGERPGALDADAPGSAWYHVSPTARRALVGNPRRVRL